MLRPFAYPVACCRMLLRVVAQSLKLVKLFSQQLPTFLLFRDRRSVAQQRWIRLHSGFQHCWGRAGSLRIVYKDLWVVSLPRCTAGPNIEPPELVTNLPRVSELGKTQHFFKFRLRGPRV